MAFSKIMKKYDKVIIRLRFGTDNSEAEVFRVYFFLQLCFLINFADHFKICFKILHENGRELLSRKLRGGKVPMRSCLETCISFLNDEFQMTGFEFSFQIVRFILIFECPEFQMKLKFIF